MTTRAIVPPRSLWQPPRLKDPVIVEKRFAESIESSSPRVLALGGVLTTLGIACAVVECRIGTYRSAGAMGFEHSNAASLVLIFAAMISVFIGAIILALGSSRQAMLRTAIATVACGWIAFVGVDAYAHFASHALQAGTHQS